MTAADFFMEVFMITDLLNLMISLYKPQNFYEGNILILFPLAMITVLFVFRAVYQLMHRG